MRDGVRESNRRLRQNCGGTLPFKKVKSNGNTELTHRKSGNSWLLVTITVI